MKEALGLISKEENYYTTTVGERGGGEQREADRFSHVCFVQDPFQRPRLPGETGMESRISH
jgi:hypothetical protein